MCQGFGIISLQSVPVEISVTLPSPVSDPSPVTLPSHSASPFPTPLRTPFPTPLPTPLCVRSGVIGKGSVEASAWSGFDARATGGGRSDTGGGRCGGGGSGGMGRSGDMGGGLKDGNRVVLPSVGHDSNHGVTGGMSMSSSSSSTSSTTAVPSTASVAAVAVAKVKARTISLWQLINADRSFLFHQVCRHIQ